MARKADTENQTVLEDYSSSLNDLTFNSKPMINVLTMLAEENELHADGIAKVIRDRIKKVDIKLKMPSLYLLDSILKNVGGDYINILSKYMVDIFTNVFENGDEKIRMAMFKLRNTWPQYFPGKFLYELDLSVKELDPNWPVIEPPSSPASIHINPKFLVKSDKVESQQVADDSMRIARLRAQQQEEKLKAEERRIKEQLKKLHEEQQKLQRSRLEEERLKHEEQLKKQHVDRARLIGEQQKQIDALKKIQDKAVPKLSASAKKIPPSSSPVKTEQFAESKNFDPRLAKREIPVLVTEKPVGKDISDVPEPVPLPASIEASVVLELQQEVAPRQQQEDPSSTLLAMPARHTELQVASPLISTEDHGTVDDINPASPPSKSNLIVEDSLVNSAVGSQINNSTALSDSQTLPSGELNTKKRLLGEDEEKAEFSPKKGGERLTEVKQDAPQNEMPVVAPPVKKRKSDESVNLRPNMFCVPMDIASSEDEGTSAVTQGPSPEVLHGRQEVDKGAEGRENISPVDAGGDAGGRFRKRNRSEWRKLMIEKAKLERRKRIPSEKELPRQMRVENHEELLDKLKMRLSSGEIKDEEHTALVKQLDLMYEVQKIRDTPEKRRTLTAADRVKMAKSVDDRSITSGSSPSKADKSDDLADRAGRLPSQKETNQDLIRQLREKRMNVEREQRESERRLKRDWNIEQLRAARRERERKDRDRDSRPRRGFDDRPDRRERESEADWRSRRRNNKGRGRGRQRATEENPRPRFSRDRDDGDRRERRPNRPDESSLKPVGSSHKQDVEKTTKIPDAAVIERGEMESKTPGPKSVDESKEKRALIENEDQNDNLRASTGKLDQGTESLEVSRPVENIDQSEIAPRELLNRDPLVLNTAVLGEEKDDLEAQRVPTEDHSRPGHQHVEATIPDLRDVRPGEGIRKGINAFKIPRKEKMAEEESGHEGSATREGLAGDVRMLSWRHQDDSDHPNNMERRGQRLNSSAPPRQPGIKQRMLANNARRGTPALLDDNFNPELTREEQLQFQAEKRAVPWQSGPRRPMEPEFREGPHPMQEEPGFEPRHHREFERRPGYMEEPESGPDYIPRPINQDHPGRMPFHQEHTNRRLSPMHPGDESFRTRPEMNINEPEFGFTGQPGRQFRGPKQRNERFRGPRFRDPRFAGPRMAGPGIQYREFKEDGYRDMDGPHFEHGGHPYEEHRDYGYEPERHQIPPDGHRNFMDRRPEFLNDRELIGPDSRYGRIEPGRENFPDPIRRPPFEASRINPEFDNRPPFSDEPGRPYQMEPDNPVQRPPEVIDHRDQHPRGFPNPAQNMEGFRPMPQDYQDRRMSPVVFDYAARQRAQDSQRASAFVNDQQPPPQYMHPPESAGFATVNPLMQMIQNVKRSTGEPGSRTPDSQADSLPEQPQAPQAFIGVRELFQQLVSTGVIPTPEIPGPAQKSATPPPTLETQETFIPEIKFVIDDLKTRHVSVINTLYVGSQCSSCGLRYPESEKQLYRDHLDWHFRVNRREKENKRSVSRPWFYAVEQWTEMDDVVDVEESAKSNFFEAEIKPEEPIVATGDGSCSVLLGPDDSFCDICFDPFEQFWDEALEEWRYKEAIRVNGKTYHLTCYSDMESGGFQSGSEQDFQSEEEKLSPMAFTGLVNTESEEYLSPDVTNTTEMYPESNLAYSRTLRPKTEPDDYRMYEGNARQISLQNTGAGSTTVNVKTEHEDLRVDEDIAMPTSPIWAATVKTEPEELIPEEIASRSLLENSDTISQTMSVFPENTACSAARADDGKSASSNDTSSINHTINDEIRGGTENFHADDIEMRNLEELSTGTGIVADASEVSCTTGESEEEMLYGNNSVNDTKSAAAIAVSDGVDNSTLESVQNRAILDGETAIMEDTDKDLNADNNSPLEVESANTEILSALDVEKTLNVEEEGNDNEKTEEERLYGRAIEDEDGTTKSEQSLASINDQIILESVTEDKEMKNVDKNIEFEGKPQS